MDKKCCRCHKIKLVESFGIEQRRKDGRKPFCLACAKRIRQIQYAKTMPQRVAANRRWRKRTGKHYLETQRVWRRNLKRRVMEGYGGKCTCCGESESMFLTLDHMNGGGGEHRKERGSYGIYLDIIEAGFPEGYTVLCMNCNWASRWGYKCPHKEATR